ncbi:MAG TPA: hypothetical protein VFT99_00765, partial [Roseiflexaceae bacterium]|nr:hypothetical protein [Roseiflexaceae bacterium]
MPIQTRDLVTTLFYAAGNTPAGDVLRAWSAREQPGQWFLLVILPDGAYGVLAYDQLVRADASATLASLVAPSPVFDDEADLATLRATPSPTGFYVIMRDGAPLGIVRQRRGAVLDIHKTPEILHPGQDVLQPINQYPNRYVNTDFTPVSDAANRLARTTALVAGGAYYFRVGIGDIEAGSIELQPASLPAAVLTSDNLLDVVVWSEDFGLDGQGQRGTLLVPAQGAVSVQTPAATPNGIPESETAARLFFRVDAPSQAGIATLRCNIYCRGLLLQSRLVRAVVGEGPALAASGARLESLLDFNLSSDLAPGLLAALEPQRLSVMLNSMDDGSHSFRFVGNSESEPVTGSVQLGSAEVGDMIELTRARLREVAWGAPGTWNGEAYRYLPDQKPAERAAQFRADLFALARRGAQQYEVI